MSNKNTQIEIFVRARPTKARVDFINFAKEDKRVEMQIPRDVSQGLINNRQETYKFQFNDIFGMQTGQEEIFKEIAQPVVDSVIEGYNGTIFAYGQTGSGKTFTITGGAERYVDRGVIPRTVAYLFSQQAANTDKQINISISYLEIYGNQGYDLLNADHSSKNLQDLPKVKPFENEGGQIYLQGLSQHKAKNEEDALNLLFIGDTNRVVAETPMNDASTRSHCIFIVQVETQQTGSDTRTVSRLHLVDLAGSERIGKTGIEGQIKTEAININLALHHLERVIVTLQQKSEGQNVFIPYRDSLMTLVLRDSLGGNCMTRMIATISMENNNLQETISTLKFAQRVAQIKNSAKLNESVDPAIVINRLKRENQELKAEIAMLRGGEVKDKLESYEIDECKQKVDNYIKTEDPSANIILNDRLKINECFYYFKTLYNSQDKRAGGGSSNQPSQGGQHSNTIQQNNSQKNQVNTQESTNEIKRLQLLVQQRDNEIMILLNLINKNKGQDQSLVIPVARNQNGDQTNQNTMDLEKSGIIQPVQFPKMSKELDIGNQILTKQTLSTLHETQQQSQQGQQQSMVGKSSFIEKEVSEVNSMLFCPLNLTNDQLMDRANSFELFRKSYRKNELMEENKTILKEKYDRGKKLGQNLNETRVKINNIKNQIEQLRKEQALKGLTQNSNEMEMKHPDEDRLTQQIDKQKIEYKNIFEELKELKSEIERIQQQIKNNRDRMQNDFDKWIAVMFKQRNLDDTKKVDISRELKDVKQLSQLPKINDKDVEKKLQSFYKARDEIKNL